MIITIDGPTASGKSSVAQALAEQLDIYYINSGLLYRSLAYILTTHYHYSLEELVHADKVVCEKIFQNNDYSYYYKKGKVTIEYRGDDITVHLKSALMDKASSIMSTNSEVRNVINEYQRLLGQKRSVIVDGRDGGTVVFPHARYKFFLTASIEVRAQRWQQMQLKQGKHYTLEECKQAIQERDERDSNRLIAPLKPAVDAQLIDNSTWSFEETVRYIYTIIKQDI